jgi:hypothetical protein
VESKLIFVLIVVLQNNDGSLSFCNGFLVVAMFVLFIIGALTRKIPNVTTSITCDLGLVNLFSFDVGK